MRTARRARMMVPRGGSEGSREEGNDDSRRDDGRPQSQRRRAEDSGEEGVGGWTRFRGARTGGGGRWSAARADWRTKQGGRSKETSVRAHRESRR